MLLLANYFSVQNSHLLVSPDGAEAENKNQAEVLLGVVDGGLMQADPGSC